mmetsp:Transcript_4863/g.12540  ORF Transcript_4863/g.12540 Transcript_4863/m.12540 type:complete len:224 (-) Transcript_4863:415-1086(-)
MPRFADYTFRIAVVTFACLVGSSTSFHLGDPSSSPPGPSTEVVGRGRRAFFFSAAAAAACVAAPEPSNAWIYQLKMPWDKVPEYTSYEAFKSMLRSDDLRSVEFGSNGATMSCIDVRGTTYILADMPDDPPLLKELYQRNVAVTLEEMKFEKRMNTVNWFRELAGFGDDITDEEMYEFRGYKTFRQNIPERSYVPANLITGYDLSRNMKKNEDMSKKFRFKQQ